jgi:hypothetical protein
VKDNDHDYQKNVVDWRTEDYDGCTFIGKRLVWAA